MAGNKSIGGWIAGIAAAVIIAIVTAVLVPKVVGSPAVGGTLESVNLQSSNPCCTFAIRSKIVGHKGERCPLGAQVFAVDLGVKYKPATISWMIADADTDEFTATVPVRLSPGHQYAIRFFLYDPSGHEMDTRDSAAFTPTT